MILEDFFVGWLHSDLLISALTVLFLIWIVQIVRIWAYKRVHLLKLAAKLPGPKPLPLFGNALQFACKPEKLLDQMVETIIPYEDATPMRLWLGPLLLIVVTEPRDIEIILNSRKSAHKGIMYQLLQPFIGDGLISGSDHTWRSHRKLIAPMFNSQSLEAYVDTIQRHLQIFVAKLKPLANGDEFDIGPYLTRCTVDAICETIMGCHDVNAQENSDQEFTHSSERMYQIVHDRMLKVWLHPDCVFRLSPSFQQQKRALQIIHDFVEKIIAAKRKELASLCDGQTDDCENRSSILEKLIRKMIQNQQILSYKELRDEIYTVYIAAQDTIAVIGNFTLLMLGIHKDVQNKVRSEVMQVLGTESHMANSMSDLKYLGMVIKETMRLFPIAPFLSRTVRSDLALDTCVLPEGCDVLIANYITQRSSRHWHHPEEFIPERFTPEEIAKRHPYAYVPFSGGLMGCIGQKFAMMSLKTIIAHVVRSYTINSTMRMEDIKLKSDISIRIVNGFRVSLESL